MYFMTLYTIFFVTLNYLKVFQNTSEQARGLVRFCKSAEMCTYVRKNLLLFQLKKALLF